MTLKQFTLFILITLSVIFINIPAYAQDKDIDYVSNLEQQLFSTNFNDQTLSDRLSRLEETIFGQPSIGETNVMRISRLQALLSPQPQVNYDNKVTSNTNKAPDDDTIYFQPDHDSNYNQNYNELNSSYYTDKEIEDYPVVSYIENKVFNQSYKGEDITKRLERLEQNIFNETRNDQSLSERVDNLKVAVIGSGNMPMNSSDGNSREIVNVPQNPYGNTYYGQPNLNSQQYYQSPEMNTFQQDPQFPNNAMQQYNNNDTQFNNYQMSNDSLSEVTTRLEEQLLGKTFMGEPLNSRLDRLENQVYHKTFPVYTPESRLERLVAYTAATENSDPYDLKQVNRMRKIQTGLTVGGILFSLLRGFLF